MFKNTDIPYEVLTAWILATFKRYKVTDIRYFGSRVHGSPREDSDIDVYILFDKKSPDRPPVFSELFKHNGKQYVIEFHPFMDFHDDYVPSWLIGPSATGNQIKKIKFTGSN